MSRKRSPTALTLDFLADMGYVPKGKSAIVERTIPDKRHTHIDWANFADIIVVHPEHGFLILQVTSDSNMSARVKKVLASDVAPVCVAKGAKVQVWGWSRRGLNNHHHLRRYTFGLDGDALYAEQEGAAIDTEAFKEATG